MLDVLTGQFIFFLSSSCLNLDICLLNKYLDVVCSGLVVFSLFPMLNDFHALAELLHRCNTSSGDKVQHQ